MEAMIINLILSYSAQYGMDPHLVVAVIQHESRFQVHARGQKGEVGLMQLLPSSFKGYTDQELEDPRVNLKLGIKYLSQVKAQCVHKNDNSWLICYNLGVYKAKKIKHPKLFPYYKNVNRIYTQLASVPSLRNVK